MSPEMIESLKLKSAIRRIFYALNGFNYNIFQLRSIKRPGVSMNSVMDYISRVSGICEMEPDRKKPAIVVAGPVNAGKSTLVNNLTGQRICPDDAAPSPFCPVNLNFSEELSAVKTVKGRNISISHRELREMFKNKRRTTMPEKVEIFLPSDILHWCSLADTPGIGLNDQTDKQVREYLAKADGIIFILHQRGIDDQTYRFLTGLASTGIKGWLCFLINVNLGHIDGSSLSDTRQAIRTIFPGTSEVFAVNTLDRSDSGLIALFLRIKAMDFFIREMENKLSRTDKTIPGMIKRMSMHVSDDIFLTKFWEVVEKAENINSTRQAIKDLPLIYGNMLNMLKSNSNRLIVDHISFPTRGKTRGAGSRPIESLISLITEIKSDKDLCRYDKDSLLNSAANSLGDRFRVVVAGPFSTGKTTFLNALLGETLLPAEDRATTSCPVTVSYGNRKKAEVDQLYKAEFFPLNNREGKYLLDSREVTALTQILETPPLRERITGAEICRDGLYKKITLSELACALDEICRYYNKSPVPTSQEKIRHIPFFTRKVPEKCISGPLISSVRLTLGKGNGIVFNLDEEFERLDFYRAISPPGSFLTESVNIYYPSQNLSFADFIDTPGLDSLQKRHYARAAAILNSGNLALFFLHAKHVLTEGIPKQLEMIANRCPDIPVFYIINYADTISELEREKVSIYIRQKLGRDSTPAGIVPYPRVYAISALNALRGDDDGFNRLLRQLRKKVNNIETEKMAEVLDSIDQWLKNLSKRETERKNRLPERTRQAALYFMGEIKRFRKRVFGNGVF